MSQSTRRRMSGSSNTASSLRLTYVAVIVISIVFVILGYVLDLIFEWTWVGFSNQTFFDWLGIVIVPVVLAAGVYRLDQTQRAQEQAQRAREQAIEDQRAQERFQDAALQGYFDQIGQLLLDRRLRHSEESDEVRALARSRTLAILDNLDATRKRHLLQFLYEARLLDKERRVIPLDGANLRGANLRYITLRDAALDGAVLEGADLRDAKLCGGDLGGTYLSGANLRDANLRGASLVDADLQRKEALSLEGADLGNADLRNTDLRAADLRGVNMAGVNLENANLKGISIEDDSEPRGADLRFAEGLTEEQLAQAIGDKSTQLEQRLRPKKWEEHH